MLHTVSPWLFEIKDKRKPYLFNSESLSHDTMIIGGGIAGVVTAYYILSLTNRKVTLIEGNRIASGATGHNAGQLTAYLERPFDEIIDEFGETMALEGQNDINSTWELLEEIKTKLDIKTPIHIFEGLSGCTTSKPVYTHLNNRFMRPKVSHQNEFCLIADDCPFLDEIPSTFSDLYTLVPRRIILDLLETTDENYCAAFTAKKGCMNSAMFCEEVVAYLHREYPDRFTIFEETPVTEIILNKTETEIILKNKCKLTARHVILCTNGFQNITITNKAGKAINTNFHEAVHGKIGFMKAYTYKDDKLPMAISYYNKQKDDYFYVTRRPSSFSANALYNLVSIGGPEHFLSNKSHYSPSYMFPETITKNIDNFIKQTRVDEYKTHYEHEFLWHGLMGYTKTGLRIIGPDKHNPLLFYNLGCNGVGILPSIFGGKKVAAFLNNDVQKKSIFDPYL